MKTLITLLPLIAMLNVTGQNPPVLLSKQDHSLKDTSAFNLNIGDQCPDFIFNNIINYKTKTAKLSDFEGKWVIIDFWFVHCSACLTMLPRMDTLQKKFSDRLQFIAVSPDKPEDIKALFSRIYDGKGIHPMSVTMEGEGILRQSFKHFYEPHYVWIDTNRIVRAITGYEQVTQNNIDLMISGKINSLPVKNDLNDFSEQNNNGKRVTDMDDNQLYLYKSFITGYQKGKISTLNISKPDSLYLNNVKIYNLYAVAYAGASEIELSKSSIIWELKDSSAYFVSHVNKIKDSSKEKTSYCYLLRLPPKYGYVYKTKESWLQALYSSKIYQQQKLAACAIMQQDLSRFFNIHARKEKRNVKCFVLYCNDSSKLITKGDRFKKQHDKVFYFTLQNGTINDFLEPFKNVFFNRIPVIDATNYKGRFDISITTRLGDVSKVNKALKKYGLIFKEEVRQMEMLVLTEY